MNDFDGLLANDFGLKPQGKSAPMAASKGSTNTTASTSGSARNSINCSGNFMVDRDSPFGLSDNQKYRDTAVFDDLFGSPASLPGKSQSLKADSSFNLNYMFNGSGDYGSKSTNSPVYDKPVYDDDIFNGVPGLKSSSKVKYDDIFVAASSAPEGGGSAFDDLLGGFGKAGRDSNSSDGKRPGKNDSSGDFNGRSVNQNAFDDLLGGFGARSSPSARPVPDIGLSSEPTARASKTTPGMTEDPFKVFESASAPHDSSSGQFVDPLEQISKFSSSRSMQNDSSVNSNGRVYDDIDPFGGLGKSVPAFSSGMNNRKDGSPPHTNTSSNWSRDKESIKRSSVRSTERQAQSRIPVDHNQEFQEVPFDIPTYPSDYDKPVNRRASSLPNNYVGFREPDVQVNMPPKYEENSELNDIWLTVSEIPLFTQPTTAPPPSRPPPPRPASANAKKKAKEAASFQSSSRFSQGPKSASAAAVASSQFDELQDFSMGRSHGNDDDHVNDHLNEELEMNSAAAAMKEAMDRAEAKFRHAKEVRERENIKASRSYLENDERVVQEDREKQERLDHERQRREREQRRLEEEKERERKEREQQLERERERAREIEREREKARQAVERATREARERAAAEARQRAERAAAEKASAEARERAERAAVQRAQAEARERAAAEAKERAEKAVAEARERANSESKEREAWDRAAAARAEARVRAERAAVERAAAEARERAAAQAREKAAAATRANQQKNENDLESFFSMGTRANSAPRPPRANSSDSVFDNQSQPDITRKSTGGSSSMKKASSSTNIVDDLSSIFGTGPSSFGEFQEVEGESEERRRARLERHQRTRERAAKALAEKNQRDLQTQREQAERHRIAETLDVEIKRWAAGKEGNLRALLSTLQYVLWPESGWQPVSLTDLITVASVRKVYRKATLCVHPDKVQQKGATLQQKYIAEKVFDLLKEAWNKFNSEELF
ncbi:auxilin-related protein 2-like [Prosopis cineraria]|uniref:auxilin-related protein 2-like n=1 Tax=Prosopis cineraria TaxID=364024 RepID=UPI0024109F93|nr:auxilin-related protein 2-like [Prosopis cineraria]